VDIDAASIEQFRQRLRWKVCYHLGSFCPSVDDVVQETLTRLLVALRDDKIRNPESMGAFISGICNHVISEYRRRLWREPPVDPDMPVREPAVNPVAENYEARQAIAAVVRELPERDRRLLQLFYLDEMDKEEICRREGISDGQFRVALFRARRRFREIYRQQVKHLASGGH
jgi:RNA polymerase sigma-70 factor, ECF subfamily